MPKTTRFDAEHNSQLINLINQTRRGFLSVCSAGALTLSGCGGSSDSSDGEEAQPPAPAPTPAPPEPQPHIPKEPGVWLVAGALGGMGVMEGRGETARISMNNGKLAISPAGEVLLLVEGALGRVSPDGTLRLFSSQPALFNVSFAADAQGQWYAVGNGAIHRLKDGDTPAWELLAGTQGAPGYRDGDAQSAQIGTAWSPVFGPDGTLYFIDQGTPNTIPAAATIRYWSRDGRVGTLAGRLGEPQWADGQGAAASFSNLSQIIAQPDGSLLAFDGSRLRMVSAQGVVTSPNPPGSTTPYVGGASGLVPVGSNAFYALQDDRVILMTADGQVTQIAGVQSNLSSPHSPEPVNGIGDAARFSRPRAMVRLPNGDLLVGDDGPALRRVNPSTREVTSWVGALLPRGHRDGTGSVARFQPRSPEWTVCKDHAGNLYIVEVDSERSTNAQSVFLVRKVSPTGEVTTLPERLDNLPSTLAVDAQGRLYYPQGAAIMRILIDGTQQVFAGREKEVGFSDGPVAEARFAVPAKLAFDSAGNLWVGDASAPQRDSDDGDDVILPSPPSRYRYGNTIRRISAQGVVTTVVGTPGLVHEGGGRPSPSVFDSLMTMKVDDHGNIYLSDSGRIQRIDSTNGTFTVLWEKSNVVLDIVTWTVTPAGQVLMTDPRIQRESVGVVIAIPEPGNQLRIVAGTNAPFRLGVRLGAEGASLNIITAMEALDEKTVLVMSEGAVLRVNLP